MSAEEHSDKVLTLAEIKPAMELKGRVTKLGLFGAFVDIGAEKEGLIHISMLSREHINRVEDVLQEGQEVEVWVHRVDHEAGRIELTMIRPIQLKWKNIKTGMRLKGNVVRVESYGAFIDVGAERPGLVHVSEISTDYVSDPRDIVSVGDEVDVSVIDFDRKKRQIRLSMKELLLEIEPDEEVEEETPTAMEVALRQALNGTDETETVPETSTDSSQETDRKELDEILDRTLKHRVRTS
ncbi:MAG: S1 RNA-binding domain-containing protein [Anaerolineaceae bacterium]|nr:MAG: S1 RNA-binding domain-containing protein [Anaerolineaceae bacterium]